MEYLKAHRAHARNVSVGTGTHTGTDTDTGTGTHTGTHTHTTVPDLPPILQIKPKAGSVMGD